MEIADWRQKIDALDDEIVRLISERARAAIAIGELKRSSGASIYEPDREQAVLAHVRAVNHGPLADTELLVIYERVMDVMRGLQRRKD